jgi:hypothetical protein
LTDATYYTGKIDGGSAEDGLNITTDWTAAGSGDELKNEWGLDWI